MVAAYSGCTEGKQLNIVWWIAAIFVGCSGESGGLLSNSSVRSRRMVISSFLEGLDLANK